MAINTLSNFGVWTGDSGAVERTRKHPVQQFRFEGVFDNFAGSLGGKELTLELFTITVPDVTFEVKVIFTLKISNNVSSLFSNPHFIIL